MKKLAIICTHPIQYYVPLFQTLAKIFELHVFYTWGEASVEKYDPGFGKIINWDIPLLEDYSFTFEKNTSSDPGSHHFRGIKNPELINHIKKYKPDFILIFGWAYHSHLQALLYFRGKIPIGFRGDSTLLNEQTGFKSVIKTIFLKWVYGHVDLAFYVGEENKNYFIKFGLKEEQLLFAPHAIDNNRFETPRSREVIQLKKELNIKEGELLFLFAGKLEPKKNPLMLLEAFKQLNALNAHLLFVGNGKLEEKLKANFFPLNTSTPFSVIRRVHYMDFQNQRRMPVVYQACDVFCLPSQGPGETWGLAINEAMACGKAVIVSDKVGCGKDLVKSGENGFIFKYDDVDELVKALNYFLLYPEKIYDFGKKSQEIIKNYTFGHIIASITGSIQNKDE